MSEELKACPFCGGEAGGVFYIKGCAPASMANTQHDADCPLAFSWSGFYRATPEEAITAWNTRASDAENQRLRAEVEQTKAIGHGWKLQAEEADEQISALRAEVEALREALAPVMDLELWTESASDSDMAIMTIGTVRKMRAALTRKVPQ